MIDKDKDIQQAKELAEQFDNLTNIYVTKEGDVHYAVPILAAIAIVNEYAVRSGSSLKEVLERQIEGMK